MRSHDPRLSTTQLADASFYCTFIKADFYFIFALAFILD